GLAGVLGALVALVGIVDSFNRTIDQVRTETAGQTPQRLTATLDNFYPVSGPEIGRIARVAGAKATEPRLTMLGQMSANGQSVGAAISTQNPNSTVWRPQLKGGTLPQQSDGIIISEKAASDLQVGLGDEVRLQTPSRSKATGLALATNTVRVSGIDANPFRVFAYVGEGFASKVGLAGFANNVAVVPRGGANQADVQKTLVTLPGVATTSPVTADTDALSNTINQFKGIIQVAAAAALVLAILMAFNLAGITTDERRREYATMFAYGLPVRSGLRIAVTENMIVGVLGTMLGVIIGLLTISWIIGSLFAETWPEIGMIRYIAPSTWLITVLVGVVAVGLTPLLMAGRMRKMNIPDTLRVVE
ncbi:MAG: hypothetical protein JHC87_10295, partial [Thermoleophilaceae bacterium]|nr:hypothetical protein [Thermoleophilaceae bacterium]